VNETVEVRIRCDHEKCNAEKEWQGTIRKYQVGLLAIWFHSFHEGHKFSYWEDGELILGKG
jgi:hypothetical protein